MRDRGWRSDRPKGTSDVVVRKHRPDYLIAILTGVLLMLGLVIIYAIGPQRANVLNLAFGGNYSDSYFFIKQFVAFGIAVTAFIVAAAMPYKVWMKLATPLLLLAFGASLLLAISGALGLPFAPEINGAVSWFQLGILGSLQPAELMKFGLLVYLAVFLGKRVKEGTVNDVKETLIPVAVVSGLAILFIVIFQRDLGTGIAIASIILTILFIAGVNKRILAIVMAGAILLASVFIMIAPHRVARVTTFFQGDSASVDDPGAYHIEQAKIALGTGGMFGVGIGNSVQATGYLPESVNDSVFAILGETFGFVGMLALMTIFITLLLRLLRVMDYLVDIRLKLLVAGVFGWFGAHVILNIAAMLGIFPLTGITLPLLSYGGTSMLFMSVALGIVFHASQYTVHSTNKEAIGYEDSRSRRGVGRTRHASRRRS